MSTTPTHQRATTDLDAPVPAEAASAHGRTVVLRFAAQSERLVLARLALTGIAEAEHIPSEIAGDLKLAVTEACTNVVQHAYPAGFAGPRDVVVRYIVEGPLIIVEVEDRGCGFDPDGIPCASADDDDEEGGMGLSIVRALTDGLRIESDTAGTRLTFSKRIDGTDL